GGGRGGRWAGGAGGGRAGGGGAPRPGGARGGGGGPGPPGGRGPPPPRHNTYMPSFRCHLAAVVVALLESVAGRPSFQKKPWSEASISTPGDNSASRRDSPIRSSTQPKDVSRPRLYLWKDTASILARV